MCTANDTGNDLGMTDANHTCTCGTGSTAVTTDQIGTETIRDHYLVEGMTCSHCVASITEEVSAVDGVESVSVDLNAGGASRLMVVTTRPVEVDAIRTAVTEAGYSLVSAE
jgi:copper chaperone